MSRAKIVPKMLCGALCEASRETKLQNFLHTKVVVVEVLQTRAPDAIAFKIDGSRASKCPLVSCYLFTEIL